MKQIGKVFLLRMNVNHVGSILDAPVGPPSVSLAYTF